jgi:hypothetical protein
MEDFRSRTRVEVERARPEPVYPEVRKLLSLEDISGILSNRYGHECVTLTDIESGIAHWFDDFFRDVRDYSSNCSDEMLPLIDISYSLYRMSQHSPPQHYALSRHFRDFYPMKKQFFPQVPNVKVPALKKYIQHYVDHVIHPLQIMTTYSADHRIRQGDWGDVNAIYNDSKWILLPDRDTGYSPNVYEFTTPDVLTEVMTLVSDGYLKPDYTHVTASDALKGIGEEGALVNSLELSDRRKIRTGEHRHWESSSYGRSKLRSVYVTPGEAFTVRYDKANWFDSYPVAFGISKDLHETNQKAAGFSYKDFEGKDTGELVRHSMIGDGTTIGDRVDLSAVHTLYTWQCKVPMLKQWQETYAPHAKIISYEAATVLNRYNETVKTYAQKYEVPPLQVWKQISEGKFDRPKTYTTWEYE